HCKATTSAAISTFKLFFVLYVFIQKPIKVNKTSIVSNRLPVKVTKEEDQLIFNGSEGGLATGLGSIYKEQNNIWIGWPGMPVEDEDKEKVSADLKSLRSEEHTSELQ